MEGLTGQALADATAMYTHREVVRSQVEALRQMQVSQNLSSLTPRLDQFPVEGGRSLSLLVLYGTVPMVQGGNTYNIPTRIWLPYPYPREPPYCEVIPTATMEVNASAAYVEPSGRLRMPYLAQFNRQTDPSAVSLVALVSEMRAYFSQTPPLYTRAPGAVARPRPPAATAEWAAEWYRAPPAAAPPPYAGVHVMPPPGPPAGLAAGPGRGAYNVPDGAGTPTPTADDADGDNVEAAIMKDSLISSLHKAAMDIALPAYMVEHTMVLDLQEQNRRTLTRSRKLTAKAESMATLERQLMEEIDRTTRKLDLLKQQNMEMAAQEVQARVAGEPDIDVLTAATPVHRQLTRLIQTAKAQEETIYYLTQKMHQYQDNLPEFLRLLRKVAKDLYTTKILTQKVRALLARA